MGYTTDFEGEFTIEPPLTMEQRAYLKGFADSRRIVRDEAKAASLSDPLREAVDLPLGAQAEYFVGTASRFSMNDKDPSVLDYNLEPRTQPGLWCKWEPNEDGTALRWNGVEKFYNYVEWLEYIQENFLNRWGRKLSGAVSWQGEDESDFGLITVGDVGIHALPGIRATDKLHRLY